MISKILPSAFGSQEFELSYLINGTYDKKWLVYLKRVGELSQLPSNAIKNSNKGVLRNKAFQIKWASHHYGSALLYNGK
ncbi:MAG: hypothetical protein WA395_03650 [Nitrososphaeraceae archaeon]